MCFCLWSTSFPLNCAPREHSKPSSTAALVLGCSLIRTSHQKCFIHNRQGAEREEKRLQTVSEEQCQHPPLFHQRRSQGGSNGGAGGYAKGYQCLVRTQKSHFAQWVGTRSSGEKYNDASFCRKLSLQTPSVGAPLTLPHPSQDGCNHLRTEIRHTSSPAFPAFIYSIL